MSYLHRVGTRHLQVAFIIFVTIALLSGCGTAATEFTPTPTAKQPVPSATLPSSAVSAATATIVPASTAAGQVVVRVAVPVFQPADIDGIKAAMEPWLNKHPEISIEWLPTPVSGYVTKLETLLAAQAAPDVIWVPMAYVQSFADKGTLLNIQTLVTQDGFDPTRYFWPGSLSVVQYKGGLYGLPQALSPKVLAYNKTLFDTAGVQYPNDKWTWDDLLQAAKKLTIQKDGKNVQFGYIPKEQDWTAFIRMNGGDIFNPEGTASVIDSPQASAALQFLADLIHIHHVSPTSDEALALLPSASPGGVLSRPLFMAGKVAMVGAEWNPDASRYATVKDLVWDIAPMPIPVGAKRMTDGQVHSYAVNAATKNPSQAYAVLRAITSDEYNSELFKQTNTPSIPAGPQETWPLTTKQFLQDKHSAKVVLDVLPYTIPSPYHPRWSEVLDATAPQFEQLWNGEKSASELTKEMKISIDKVLETK